VDSTSDMLLWTFEKKDWCCRHWAPSKDRQGPIQQLNPEDMATFVSVAIVLADHAASGASEPPELSVLRDEVLRVYSKNQLGMTYALKADGTTGLVPSSILQPAKAVMATSDFTATHAEQQISLKIGDIAWLLKESANNPGWTLVYLRGQVGWVPSTSLTLDKGKSGVNTVATLVTEDFHACALAEHPQLSLKHGDMVWSAGDRSSSWTYSRDDLGEKGWVPSHVLLQMQPALVQQAFRASRVGHYFPQISLMEGDTVWLTGKQEPGWVFIHSEKKAGWVPDDVLHRSTGMPVDSADPDSHASPYQASMVIWGLAAAAALIALAVGFLFQLSAQRAASRQEFYQDNMLPSSPRALAQVLRRRGGAALCVEEFRGLPPSEAQAGPLDLCV